jgi:hypothetical protein
MPLNVVPILALSLLLTPARATETYRFTILNPSIPNYTLGSPQAINDRGDVLFNGTNNTTGVADGIFIQGKHGIIRVHFPGVQPYAANGTALSQDETVGGVISQTSQSARMGFELSDEGNLRIMPPAPAGADSRFYGMNNRGDFTLSGPNQLVAEQVHFFAHGSYFPIQYPGEGRHSAVGISNDDTVVGSLGHFAAAYILRKGVFTVIRVPGADRTQASCISDSGHFMCVRSSSSSESHCFIRNHEGELTLIDFQPPQTINGAHGLQTLQDFSSLINGVNDRGQVCGFCVATYGNSTSTDVVQFSFSGEPQHGP